MGSHEACADQRIMKQFCNSNDSDLRKIALKHKNDVDLINNIKNRQFSNKFLIHNQIKSISYKLQADYFLARKPNNIIFICFPCNRAKVEKSSILCSVGDQCASRIHRNFDLPQNFAPALPIYSESLNELSDSAIPLNMRIPFKKNQRVNCATRFKSRLDKGLNSQLLSFINRKKANQ
jgi:hypothetical protein